jgi:hypothetical protein
MAAMKRHIAASVGFLDRTPVQKARKTKAKKNNLAQKPWKNIENHPCKKFEYCSWVQ